MSKSPWFRLVILYSLLVCAACAAAEDDQNQTQPQTQTQDRQLLDRQFQSAVAQYEHAKTVLQQSKAQLAQDVLGEEGFTGSLSKTDFDYLLEDTSEELEPTSEG